MDSVHSHQRLQYDECSLEPDCVPHAVPMVLGWGEEVEAMMDSCVKITQRCVSLKLLMLPVKNNMSVIEGSCPLLFQDRPPKQ